MRVSISSRAVVCAAFVLLSTGCITVKVSGTSGRVLKKASISSPLIALSDEFYPGDKPQTSDGIVKSLPPAAVAQIQKDLNKLLEALKQTHVAVLKYLQTESGSNMPASLPISLRIEREAIAIAEIRTDNTIYIDIEVLQAFFKTAILDLSRGGAVGHRNAPADADEDKIVQNFLEFKRDLRKTKGHTIIGEALHGGDDWFALVDMSEEMSRLTSRYYGVLLFTISHEMGHYALGHLKEKSNDCTRAAERELEADRYGTALMSAAVPELPGVFGLLDFNGNREQLRGYEPFFQFGYKMARFSGISMGNCPYPPPDERLKLAQAEETRATQRLYDEGYITLKAPQK
jgi:hypothetical protein